MLIYEVTLANPYSAATHFGGVTVTVPRTQTTPVTVRDKTYDELTYAEKLHESYDIKAKNIVLQGLPQDIYNLVNHHEEAKHIWDRVKLLIEGSTILLQERESKLYDDFDMFTSVPRETVHSYYLRSNAKGVNRARGTNTSGKTKVIRCYNCQEEGYMARQCTKPKRPRNSAWFKKKAMLVEALESRMVLDEKQMAFLADNEDIVTTGQQYREIPTPEAFQTYDLDAFDSDCDEAPSASVVLMAKLYSYDSKILL
ncbi:putative reverse transcriptase domain-containing protein, partial [Tanacetum coccineum]